MEYILERAICRLIHPAHLIAPNNPAQNILSQGYNPDFCIYYRTGETFIDDGSSTHQIDSGGRQTFNSYWEIATEPTFPNDSLLQRHTNIQSFGIAGSNSTGFDLPPTYEPAVFGSIDPSAPVRNWPLVKGDLSNDYPKYGYKASLRLNENQIDDFFGEKRLQFLGQHNPRAPFSSKTPLVLDRFVSSNSARGIREHPSFIGGFTDTSAATWYQIQESLSFAGANIGYSDTAFGNERAILFELPDPDMPFVSLMQLGMANLARTNDWDEYPSLNSQYNFIHGNYQPAFALGNSIPDARIPDDEVSIRWRDHPGVDRNQQELFGVHYDYSYLLNDALFDRFFMTSEIEGALATAGDRVNFPLENRRLFPVDDSGMLYEQLRSYDATGSELMLDGAFNINSVSVEAWMSLLGSLYGEEVIWNDPTSGAERREDGAVQSAFACFFRPAGESIDPGSTTVAGDGNYLGYRRLDGQEIEDLSAAIVVEIQRRKASGRPFLSLAEFVNRDPNATDPESRHRGVLQAAIDAVGLNDHLEQPSNMVDPDNGFTSPYPGNQMEGSISTGVPGFFMQSDLLLKLGPLLSARSDTFRIRSYGSSTDQVGASEQETWCEAVVQRVPDEVEVGGTFGRRFVIKSFRWLQSDEI